MVFVDFSLLVNEVGVYTIYYKYDDNGNIHTVSCQVHLLSNKSPVVNTNDIEIEEGDLPNYSDYIDVVDPSDIDDVNANGVVIAPNPASDAINVVAEGLESVTIVDMLGRTVAISSEATVNVSNLPAGTYAVVVKTSAAEVVKKINVIK